MEASATASNTIISVPLYWELNTESASSAILPLKNEVTPTDIPSAEETSHPLNRLLPLTGTSSHYRYIHPSPARAPSDTGLFTRRQTDISLSPPSLTVTLTPAHKADAGVHMNWFENCSLKCMKNGSRLEMQIFLPKLFLETCKASLTTNTLMLAS